MEAEVGISLRLGEGNPFASVLKSKFQDFHVREIDSEGTVMFLDELITRNDVSNEMELKKSEINAAYDLLGPNFMLDPEAEVALTGLLSTEDMEGLKSFLGTDIDESKPYCVMACSELNESKDRRKQFHDTIRRFFGEVLVSDTLESEAGRSIRVWIKKFHEQEQRKYKQEAILAGAGSSAGNRGKKRAKPSPRDNSGVSVGVMMKDPWPKDRPDYLFFRLYKENRDTAEAIQSIARCLRIPPKSFQFCGTKDRRGVTVQSVSVYRISIESFKRAMLHSAWDKAVRVSHFEYREVPNKIGRSRGNQFEVCLRHVDPPEFSPDRINNLFRSLQEVGFLNYYGLQRFGTRAVRTHHIGGQLLKGDWKGVVDALLSPEADNRRESVVEQEEAEKAVANRNEWRKLYAQGDVEKAHELCPSFLYIEKCLLRALHQSGQSTNYLNAIQALPPSTCSMYLHAVQSLAFNFALTERINRFGLQVQVGDLVSSSCDETTERAKLITSLEEALEYSIYDVVLPLVGDSVEIPINMEAFFNEFFTNRFGFDMEILRNKSLPQIVQLRGAYRHIVQKPANLEWRIVPHVTEDQLVIQSDVDKLRNEPVKIDETLTGGGSTAVVFKCDLNSGVYLTMAIREVSSVRE